MKKIKAPEIKEIDTTSPPLLVEPGRTDYNWMDIVSTIITSNWQLNEIDVQVKRRGVITTEKKTQIKFRYKTHRLSFTVDKQFNFDEAKNWFMRSLLNIIEYDEDRAKQRSEELS